MDEGAAAAAAAATATVTAATTATAAVVGRRPAANKDNDGVCAGYAAAATAKGHSNGRTALMAPRVASYLRAAPAREPLALAAVVWWSHPDAGVARARHGARRILWQRRHSQVSQVCPWRRRRRRLHAT